MTLFTSKKNIVKKAVKKNASIKYIEAFYISRR